jgi:predicted TIM-barrel fold metal-dependent hydrolase
MDGPSEVQTVTSEPEAVLEPQLRIVDPHHHLWDFENSRYLLPELLDDIGSGHAVEATVFVECTAFYSAYAKEQFKMVGETEFVSGVAAMADSGRYGKVRVAQGIVGRADLTLGSAVGEVLDTHIRAGSGRFRGIRHAAGWDQSPDVRNSHTDPPPELYSDRKFRDGFAELGKRGLSFDAWQYHTQLGEVTALARAFPDTAIVLDHVGGLLGIGPYAGKRQEIFGQWSTNIRVLAECPNVFVKLGGLGMAICGFEFHKRETLPSSEILAAAWRPYLETCIEAFSPKRAMFESNFPVDRVSCSYRTLWNAFKIVAKNASAAEKDSLFRGAASTFYRLT